MVAAPGAGVILTTDKEAIKKVFSSGGSMKDSRDLSENLFLFDTSKNSNLIKFYAQWDFTRRAVPHSFELEIVDTTGRFEEEFLKVDLPSELRNRFIFSGDFIKNKPYDSIPEVSVSGVSRSLDKFQANRLGSSEFVTPNKFYLSYGSGDSLDEWAGPFLVYLVDANIDISSNKARVITLKFIYNDSFVSLPDSLDKVSPLLSVEGFGLRWHGESDQITLDNNQIRKVESILSKSLTDQGLLGSLYGEKAGTIRPGSNRTYRQQAANTLFLEISKVIDFHAIITQTLRSYLRKVCQTPNVLVIIPNINIANYNTIADKFYREIC